MQPATTTPASAAKAGPKRVVLIGNPNVGKSALFMRLTGIHATISNYPGTTVAYQDGMARLHGESVEVLDTPGTYSLAGGNPAEQVAADLAELADVAVCVVDATNLERNLMLLLQVLERGLPTVVALNMADDARQKGIGIDTAALARRLGVPVVPTVAVSGEGIHELGEAIHAALRSPRGEGCEARGVEARWAAAGEIAREVQTLAHRHPTFLERLQDWSVHPLGGVGVAALLLAAMFAIVRFLGEGLIAWVFDPFFQGPYRAWVIAPLEAGLRDGSVLYHLLLGSRVPVEGSLVIDLKQSMGLLTTAPYVEFGMVLPYLLAFYLVLSVLEDVGYLPRLAVVLDRAMHQLGLHGFSVIPMLLGFGCNVPGILATRSLETKRQRFIACTLISIGVPCVALQAMIIQLVGVHGLRYVAAVYAFLAGVIFILGRLLRRLCRGGAMPELLLEIPPYRWPVPRLVLLKLWRQGKGFLLEATPLVLLGVLLMNLLLWLRWFDGIARLAGPLVRQVWGLPAEAVLPVAIGVLRKDVAAGMLLPLKLALPQLMTASVLLALTFPCIATFAVLFNELGWKDTLKSVGIMAAAAVIFGGLANLLFTALL
ncbi:MAG: ferrous iron transporter B [Lentisphaeria bacterium]|jgi:ferrous iron transport protein B